ncbi:MAG TPA: glycosyltransferase [Terriglobales bacterium]|nr:glycosyltransferase [Terriglobales bacterium]
MNGEDLPTPEHHISVCICTFKRPELLQGLLAKLEHQQTENLFTYSIVIADNDAACSAQPVVSVFSAASSLRVIYCVEPQQNIARVRNKAVEQADGDLIAFLDDDEFPVEDWLLRLYKTYTGFGVDGVLGPVKPHFNFDPPKWVIKGRFFERPDYPTGYRLTFSETRTGNVLFRKDIVNGSGPAFNPEFGTAGEDVDFFRRMMEKGCRFVWCTEAVAYEVVPAWRCKRSYLLKRALLRGSNFPKHPRNRLKNLAKSLVAVPCYTLALPILALIGHHFFLAYLIKLLDHGSRLLSVLGLSVVTRRET